MKNEKIKLNKNNSANEKTYNKKGIIK